MNPRRWALSLARKVVALAPLLLLMIVSLPSELMMRCRMDGLLRPACCCPPEDDAATDTAPVARPADCCDPVLTADVRLPAEKTGADDSIQPQPVALAAMTVDAPVARRWTAAASAHDPAREGPPIILLKQSFLI